MERGKFIVFEGIDGSGKTTVINKLQQEYNGFEYTCEPTDTPLGHLIREKLKDDDLFNIKQSEDILSLLFTSDTLEHVYGVNGIQQRIERGEHVISDRFYFSNLVYTIAQKQVANKSDMFRPLHVFTSYNNAIIKPDLVIYLSVDVKTALQRMASKDTDNNEKEDILYAVQYEYNRFFDRQTRYPSFMKQCKIIDTMGKSIDEVYGEVNNAINVCLEEDRNEYEDKNE